MNTKGKSSDCSTKNPKLLIKELIVMIISRFTGKTLKPIVKPISPNLTPTFQQINATIRFPFFIMELMLSPKTEKTLFHSKIKNF